MTKTFQALSTNGRWITLGDKKKTFNEKRDAGIPIRILHENGGFFTIENADKLPEGIPAKFSAKQAEKAKAKAEAKAEA